MGSTNTPIVLSIFGFYIIIGVILGLAGESLAVGAANATFTTPPNPSILGFLTQIGYFFAGIAYSLSSLPAWADILLFLPLGVTLFYIGLSFLRGSS